MAFNINQDNIKLLQSLSEHKSDVTSCDFAPNFTLVTGSSDKTTRVWQWISGTGYVQKSYSPLIGHKYGVTCVRVSPQGSMLATTSIDGTAILWNLYSGIKIYTMVQINGDAIRVCRFAPDSSILVTAGDNGAICVWDLIHRNLIRAIFQHQGTTQSLAFTPDSQYLISACSLEIIRVWYVPDLIDTTNQNDVTSSVVIDNAHDLGVLCVDASSVILTDENDPFIKYYTIATSGNSQNIKIWKITSHTTPKKKLSQNEVTMEHVGTFIGHRSAVTSVKYSSNGVYLISSSLDKYVKIWDNNGGCLATLKGHVRYINCVSFSRDGALAASCSIDKTTIVWDLTGNISLDSELIKPVAQIGNSLYNLQEMQLVESAETSDSAQLLERIDDISEGAINSCSFFGNHLLATGSSDKLVKLLTIEENNNIEETNSSPFDGHTYCVNHVEFSMDGSKLATCSLDGCTIIWNPLTGEKIMEFIQSSLAIRDCRFSVDGSLLVACGDKEKANVWNVETGESLLILEGHTDAVTSACFSPDTQIIATTCNNSDFRLWSMAGDNIHTQDDAHDLGIQNSDFSLNLEPIPYNIASNNTQCYLLATCGNDSLAKLWKISVPKVDDSYDYESVEVIMWRSLQGHGGNVTCVRFAMPLGEIVCSTATDRQARIWSTYSGECLHVLDHDSIVTSCAFSLNCSLLAIGCLDKTLWVWKLPRQLVVQSSLINRITGYRKKLLINWNTDDVIRWLQDIDFEDIVPNVSNVNLDGQKILTLEEERICAGLDLGDEYTERFMNELKWLKLDELQIPHLSESQVPSEFLCPITHEVMREPVTCGDGFTYEKQAITEWFMAGKFTSPMTNVILNDTAYKMNQELRNAIHQYLYSDI